MSRLPAEHYAKRYMEQAWGGKAAMPYRHLLKEIRDELHNPRERCPECEMPGFPYVAGWPSKRPSRDHPKAWEGRKYLICPWCGHKSNLYTRPLKQQWVFTKEQVQQMADMYQSGVTPAEIGKAFNCVEGTVRNYLKRMGVPLRPRGGSVPLRGVSHRELETIRFLYEKLGWTQAQIANYTGLTIAKVNRRIHQGGMYRFGKRSKYYKRPKKYISKKGKVAA